MRTTNPIIPICALLTLSTAIQFPTLSNLHTALQPGPPAQPCSSFRTAHLKTLATSLSHATPCNKTTPACLSPSTLQSTLTALQTLVCPPPATALASLLRPLQTLLNPPPATSMYTPRVIEPLLAPHSALLLLHGLGRTPSAWDAYLPHLRIHLPHTRLILPQAPTQHVSGIPGPNRPSWYDIPSVEPFGPEARDEIIAAASNIASLAGAQGVPSNRVAIAGMSQGGALALSAYLRFPFAACVSISGYLPIAGAYPAEVANGVPEAPVLMFHGDADGVLPVLAGRLSAEKMGEIGRKVRYVEFEGDEHLVPGHFEEVLTGMVDVLGNALREER